MKKIKYGVKTGFSTTICPYDLNTEEPIYVGSKTCSALCSHNIKTDKGYVLCSRCELHKRPFRKVKI